MSEESDVRKICPVKVTRYQSGVQICIINAYCSLREEATEENIFQTHCDLIMRISKLMKVSDKIYFLLGICDFVHNFHCCSLQ